jgi:hypothetical protein
VAKIQDGAQAALGFVLADDVRLDLTAARDDFTKRLGFAAEEFWQVTLQPGEKSYAEADLKAIAEKVTAAAAKLGAALRG